MASGVDRLKSLMNRELEEVPAKEDKQGSSGLDRLNALMQSAGNTKSAAPEPEKRDAQNEKIRQDAAEAIFQGERAQDVQGMIRDYADISQAIRTAEAAPTKTNLFFVMTPEERQQTEQNLRATRAQRAGNEAERLSLPGVGAAASPTAWMTTDPADTRRYWQLAQENQVLDQRAAEQSTRLNLSEIGSWKQERGKQYAGIRENPDYAAMSQPDEKKTIRGLTPARTTGNLSIYNYVNDLDGYKDRMKNGPDRGEPLRKYDFLTAKERADYNYVTANQGLDAGKAYLEYLDYDLNVRMTQAAEQEARIRASESPVGASALSVAQNLAAGAGIVSGVAQGVRKAFTGRPVDYNTAAFLPSRLSTATREQVAADIEKKHPNATVAGLNVWSFLYQTGMSMADSGMIAAMTLLGVPGATALLGGAAGTSAALDVKERGGSDLQALSYGLAAGFAESLFEEVSLEKLIHPKTADGLRGVLMNIARQAFTEGSEEFTTTLANTLTDAIINGDKSELLAKQRQLVQSGMTEEEAREQAWKDWTVSLAADFLGGAIAGGIMGGGSSAINFALETNLRKAGQAMRSLGVTNADVQDALLTAMNGAQDAQSRAWLSDMADRAARGEDLAGKLPLADLGRVFALRADLGPNRISETAYLQAARNASKPYLEDGRAAETPALTLPTAQEAAAASPAAQEASAARERAATAPAAEAAQRAAEGLTGETGDVYTEERAGLRLPTVETGGQTETETPRLALLTRDDQARARDLRSKLTAELTPLLTGTQEDMESAMSALYARSEVTDALQGEGLLTQEDIDKKTPGAMLRAAVNYAKGAVNYGQGQETGQRASAADVGGQQGAGAAEIRSREPGRSRTGGGSQRKNRVGSGGQSFSQRVEQIRQGWQRQEGAGRLRAAVEALGAGERVSTAALGIGGGTDRATAALLPERMDAKTEKELAPFREAQQSFAQRGISVKGFTGTLEMEDADGSVFRARGAVSEDGKTIWVRLDHPDLTWQQILDHEDFHERVKNDKQLLRDAAAAFDRDFTEAERRAIVNDYCDTYGYFNVSEDYVLEEVLADYYAGIDIYAGTENAQKDIEARGRNVRETVGSRGEAVSEEAGGEMRASREDALVTNQDEVLDYSGMTDQEAEAQANEVVFSRETDPETLDFLNNQETVTVYRAMQTMWGRLYPPMAAKVRGEDGKRHWVEPTEYGQWYRSDEHPELVDENGKFLLDKGDGTSLKAAYNPYFHTSNSPLNDQFTSAYRRKNLVIVECSIPKSELTSGYRAEGAKDTVGEMNWHSGPVSSKLKGDKARRVTLSRWVRVERIVPEAEAAQKIAELLDGTGLEIPANTVTPALREELEKQGVKIGATRGTVKASREADAAYLSAVEAGDMETAQRMVDEAAERAFSDSAVRDEDGRLLMVYHGGEKNYTVFDRTKGRSNMDIQGTFFTPWELDAQGYGSNVRRFFLNLTNPADESVGYRALNRYKGQNGAGIKAREYLVARGYDGVNNGGEEYIAFTSEQIKSADPVTYDDQGNVIPLSERFDPEKQDIRWSRETEGPDAQEARRSDPMEGQFGFFGDDGTETWTPETPRPRFSDHDGTFVRLYKDFAKNLTKTRRWTGKEFNEFYAAHPEYDFVQRFKNGDGKTRDDLRTFVSGIDDIKTLEGMAWYTTQSHWNGDGAYRGAITKARNVYNARIKELRAAQAGGHEIKLEHREYSVDEAKELFTRLNSNDAVAKLAEKVFATAERIGGIRVYGTNRILGKWNASVLGTNAGGEVWLRINGFADPTMTDQYKAASIVHEFIHACTMYAIRDSYVNGQEISHEMLRAVNTLRDIYNQVRNDPDFSGVYGASEFPEFVAELANPRFREKLEKKSLWQRIVETLRKFFGIQDDNALNGAAAALDYILDNADVESARDYYRQQERAIRQLERSSGVTRWSRDIPGETEELRAENEALKDRLAYWQSQVKPSDRTQPREEDVRRVARDILKSYESAADREAVTAALRELAHTVMSEDVRWADVRDQATRLAGSVLEGARRLDENGELHREIRAAIREKKVSFSGQADIPDYNLWRRANFGKLTIAKDGIPVETRWQELQDAFGEGYFPEDIANPTDKVLYLAELWDRLRDVYENPYSADLAEATQYLANELIDRVLGEEIRQAPTTYADRAETRIAREALKGELRVQKVKALLDAERERRRSQVANLKEHYKAKEAKSRESRKARELRTKITKHARKMTEELLHPTDKRHIPESLRRGVASVLSAIDLGSGYSIVYDRDGNYKRVERGLELGAEETRRTQAFLAMKKALQAEADGLVLDPALLGTMEEPGSLERLVTELADKPISNMNSEELQVVYDALRGVEAAVRSANRMLSQARWGTVSEAADALRSDNAGKAAPLELAGYPGRVQGLTRLDMLTPEGYFHRLGRAGQAVFKMLRGAQDAFITNMADATEDTRKIIGDMNTGALEREQHKVTMGGEEVTMTTAQIMELYCLMQRDQGMQHIMTGGILIEPVRQGVKKTTQTEPLHPSLGELADAVKLLTAEEIRVADALQQYLSVDMAELGNEATLAVYGYKKFGQEEKYWKIRSNRNELQQSIEKETQTTSVANRGFTKAVNPRADTSVKIGSIFDTYSQSINDMATYAAWLAVGEDVNRIRNYVWRDADGQRAGTVKGILDRVIGSGGANYLQRLLADIANGAGTDDTGLTSGFVGAYKAAAIGANIRVIIQQPTAILRALEMIDPKYMAGLRNPMKAFDRAKKYSPIAQWKDWGYFDINTGRKMKDVLFENPSKLEKLRQVSMALAGKADSFAWGILWGAVEAETKATTDLTPGTEAFYHACAERFNDIIDHTQVVDGILQRSQIMRSKDTITRMAVSFMSEPTKQYNQFMNAVWDLRHSNSAAEKNAAKQHMARTVFSMLAAGIANVLAQSIIDALRDDDREKTYWEKLLQKFLGYDPKDDTFGKRWQTFWRSNMGELVNPASYLPYAKDIMSIIQGYSVDRMDMDAISDTITAMTRVYKALNGEGKQTAGYTLIKLMEQASKLLGLPLYNIDRDITSLITTVANDAEMPLLQYYLNRYRYKPAASGNLTAAMKGILWDARQKGDGSYDIIVGKLLKDGYSQDIIDKTMLGKLEEESGYKAAVKAADAAGNANKSYDVREKLTALQSLTIPEDERDQIMADQLSEKQYENFHALMDAGMSFAEVTLSYMKYAELDAEDLTTSEKANTFALWVDKQPYTDEQKRAVKERLTYWQSMPLEAGRYEKFTGAGLSPDEAYELNQDIGALEPLPGKSSVSDAQRYDVILASNLSEKKKLAAIGTVMGTDLKTESGNPTQWAKVNAAVDAGLKLDAVMGMVREDTLDYFTKYRDAGLGANDSMNLAKAIKALKPEAGKSQVSDIQKWQAAIRTVSGQFNQDKALRALMDDSAEAKYDAAYSAGINPDVYVKYKADTKDFSSEYDANGKEIKGQTKKDKFMSYIDGLNLTNPQKDALYFASGYSESTLEKDAPWHSGGGRGGSGLYNRATTPTLRLPTIEDFEDQPVRGLRLPTA